LTGIFSTLNSCAQISKLAGGIGFSCTNVRAKGSLIKKLNGKSDGLVPMLKVFNHTARYVNQGGKRKGAFASYLEPWHPDIEDWVQLKLNHGDEEMRARDLFYALWIPDVFMSAVEADKDWYLICPSDAPDLQDAYGDEFEALYNSYVEKGIYKRKIKARQLWSLICRVQIETGGPYIMYKDAVNRKNNQSNLGTIRSSNLCAEICEYSSKDQISVCTLASLCLPKFVGVNGFSFRKLEKAAYICCKNLNKVIDKTTYPLEQSYVSNNMHRPIGIGVQGLADVFHIMNIPYDSQEARDLNKRIFETIYYSSMKCSIDLAEINGPYQSFHGSPLSEGKFAFDLWDVEPEHYDWNKLRDRVMKFGAVNSLLIACMPTASTAQINGNTESFEPCTSNLYVRRVLSGEFMIVNKNLEKLCRKKGLWTEKLVKQIIADKGSVQNTDLPDEIKNVFKTVWEISNKALIDLSADRGPFVCQSQSLNLYLDSPNEGAISSMQFYAWKKGLKTGQYYLRTRAAASAVQFTCESCSA
jgi:ribonucleoside-diphosphate reductase alpha chain